MSILINAVKVEDDYTIEYSANPKRPTSKAYARYTAYSKATNIKDYLDICLEGGTKKFARPDLRYDEAHGFLKVFNLDGECINPNEEPVTEEKETTKK